MHLNTSSKIRLCQFPAFLCCIFFQYTSQQVSRFYLFQLEKGHSYLSFLLSLQSCLSVHNELQRLCAMVFQMDMEVACLLRKCLLLDENHKDENPAIVLEYLF